MKPKKKFYVNPKVKIIPPVYSVEPDFKTIGLKLKAERERLGYTQEKVAEIIEITPAFVGHLERGERSMSLGTLIRFCNFYNTTIDFLLSDVLPSKDDDVLTQIAAILKDKSPKQQTAILDMLKVFSRHI